MARERLDEVRRRQGNVQEEADAVLVSALPQISGERHHVIVVTR